MSVDSIFSDIASEVLRAEAKFPDWPGDLIHGAAIMAEESGEAVQAALDCHYQCEPLTTYRTELLHTAAMCVRALLDLERREREKE